MSSQAHEARVARRPRDRRERIIEGAAELFAERGFQAVTTQEIADRQGITAGALYRHFESKADLLYAIFDEYFRRGAPDDGDYASVADMIAARVASTSTAPFLGPLWIREAGQLEARRHAELSRLLRVEFARWSRMLRQERPDLAPDHADLLGMTLTAVLTAATQRFRGLRNADKLAVVSAACHAVARLDWADVPGTARVGDQGTGALPATPAERILAVAQTHFGRDGYDDASLAVIGRGAGIAAASIYGHYASKAELWECALERARHRLWLDLGAALAASPDAGSQLRALVNAYVVVLHVGPRLVVEAVAAPAGDAYQQEWTHLLRRASADLSQAAAAATVSTALSVMNSLAATPDVLARPDFEAAAAAVGAAILLPATASTEPT